MIIPYCKEIKDQNTEEVDSYVEALEKYTLTHIVIHGK